MKKWKLFLLEPLMRVKEQANALNIPYQSLMKEYIAAGVFKTEKKS